LVTPTHFFYAAPRIADPDPVSAVLTPSLVFRETPEQRKRRREPDGEIADEEESAAFHLISVQQPGHSTLRRVGPAFPRVESV